MIKNIKFQPDNLIDWIKTENDLNFIKKFKIFCESNKCRIVVSGGYGLDILLGKITRSHNDVDILIYGQINREKAQEFVNNFLIINFDNPTISSKDETYYLDIDVNVKGFGANIYYIQTVEDPFETTSKVIKNNGEQITNDPNKFLNPIIGTLSDLQIEVQNPNFHLADILSKQQTQVKRIEHDQDIYNLKLLTTLL